MGPANVAGAAPSEPSPATCGDAGPLARLWTLGGATLDLLRRRPQDVGVRGARSQRIWHEDGLAVEVRLTDDVLELVARRATSIIRQGERTWVNSLEIEPEFDSW